MLYLPWGPIIMSHAEFAPLAVMSQGGTPCSTILTPRAFLCRSNGRLVLRLWKGRFPRLKLIWADAGYAGQLIEWTRRLGRWALEIVKRTDDMMGFVVLPKRWIVERTFAWFGRYRRLSKDYETLTESSEAVIYLAMTHLMLRRLKPAA